MEQKIGRAENSVTEHNSVATKIFVATKMTLVAAPDNDRLPNTKLGPSIDVVVPMTKKYLKK